MQCLYTLFYCWTISFYCEFFPCLHQYDTDICWYLFLIAAQFKWIHTNTIDRSTKCESGANEITLLKLHHRRASFDDRVLVFVYQFGLFGNWVLFLLNHLDWPMRIMCLFTAKIVFIDDFEWIEKCISQCRHWTAQLIEFKIEKLFTTYSQKNNNRIATQTMQLQDHRKRLREKSFIE